MLNFGFEVTDVCYFEVKVRAPTTRPHGGAAPSPAKITSLLSCHLGTAVRLGHPRDRSQAATTLT